MFGADSFGPPAWFPLIFGLVSLLVVAAFIFIIVVVVRNASAARRQGYDPVTMQTDIAGQFGNNLRNGAPKSAQERLAELDALRESQAISAAEYDDARSRILRDL